MWRSTITLPVGRSIAYVMFSKEIRSVSLSGWKVLRGVSLTPSFVSAS